MSIYNPQLSNPSTRYFPHEKGGLFKNTCKQQYKIVMTICNIQYI